MRYFSRRSTFWLTGLAAAYALASLCFTNNFTAHDYQLFDCANTTANIPIVDDDNVFTNKTTTTTRTTLFFNEEHGSSVNESRPALVLHIGPHKTATSTIQCDLTYFRSQLRDKANFIYLGRQYGECKNPTIATTNSALPDYSVDTRRLINCLNHHNVHSNSATSSRCDDKPEWIRFEQTLASLAQAKLNAIISDEAFSRMKITDANLDLLLGTLSQHFHVRVVVVYRHYFSWLLSQYNEHYKPLWNRKFYQLWPRERGGSYIRPFVEYYETHERHRQNKANYQAAVAKGNYQHAADSSDLHPVAYLKKRWSSNSAVVDDVIVVNMHERGDVTTNFVRQALSPEAYNVIHDLKSDGHAAPGRANPSLQLDFDMLAVEAREMGLFPQSKRLSRRMVAHYVEKLFETAAMDASELPHVCLNETQQMQFLNRTLFLERTVFSDQQLQMQKQKQQQSLQNQHKEDFADAIQRHKFCNLATKELLASDEVQSIFRALNAI